MARQPVLPLGNTWGGARRGAGRKPRSGRAGVPHVRRGAHSRHEPLHVTVRMRRGLPSLRSQSLFFGVLAQIGAAKRRFLRIVHYSVQSNHIHMIIEANDRSCLARGMKGFAVRVARHLNGLLSSRGQIWGDRYHVRALKTPRQVRNTLIYVLFNHTKHGRSAAYDPCSSAQFFRDWLHGHTHRSDVGGHDGLAAVHGLKEARGSPDDWPVAPGETWLLTRGWKRFGRLDPRDRPRIK